MVNYNVEAIRIKTHENASANVLCSRFIIKEEPT